MIDTAQKNSINFIDFFIVNWKYCIFLKENLTDESPEKKFWVAKLILIALHCYFWRKFDWDLREVTVYTKKKLMNQIDEAIGQLPLHRLIWDIWLKISMIVFISYVICASTKRYRCRNKSFINYKQYKVYYWLIDLFLINIIIEFFKEINFRVFFFIHILIDCLLYFLYILWFMIMYIFPIPYIPCSIKFHWLELPSIK